MSHLQSLRHLYFVRFGFAVVWAVLLGLTATHLGPVATVLVVLYPVVDVTAALIDARTSGAGARPLLVVNIALSTLAVVGLAIASTTGIADVLRVWGAWAVVAGLLQLVVGLRRRSLGGQWAMIISGAGSVLAGAAFVAGSAASGATLVNLAGYAAVGGVFFLVSALRLTRVARSSVSSEPQPVPTR